MNAQTKIKVMVIDDHPVVLAGLSAIVRYQEDFQLVGEATNGSEAIKLFDAYTPDVTLVDLSLPDLSGIELIAILSKKSSTARFIVLTSNAGGSEIGKALQAGAHAYLFKNTPSDELLGAIRTVSAGGRYLSRAVVRKADEVAAYPGLTSRELEVLQWMVRGHSNVLIAREMGVTEDTIKFHIKNVFGKLDVSSRGKAVAQALKSGLVQSDGS